MFYIFRNSMFFFGGVGVGFGQGQNKVGLSLDVVSYYLQVFVSVFAGFCGL